MDLSTDLPELLWGNRTEPLYAAHNSFKRSAPVSKDKALFRLAEGTLYFAPVPRLTAGNTKADCATTFDALAVDIDREPKVSVDDLLQDTQTRLPGDFWPTAVVFSGNRGVHLYWKLEHDLEVAEIESWNKALAVHVGGDINCHDRTRLLRNPGTVHPKSGKRCEIIELSGVVHPIERLSSVPRPHRDRSPRAFARDRARGAGERADWELAAERLGGWSAPSNVSPASLMHWVNYMRVLPAKGWRWHGKSRSEVEQAIVAQLVGKGVGASDMQIIEIADVYFAKHLEEWPVRGDEYILRTIEKARAWYYERGWITSRDGGAPRRRDTRWRHTSIDGYQSYYDLISGQPVADWVRDVQSLGCSKSTAYRVKDRFSKVGLAEVRDGCIIAT